MLSAAAHLATQMVRVKVEQDNADYHAAPELGFL